MNFQKGHPPATVAGAQGAYLGWPVTTKAITIMAASANPNQSHCERSAPGSFICGSLPARSKGKEAGRHEDGSG
jgi:hypothetical protein